MPRWLSLTGRAERDLAGLPERDRAAVKRALDQLVIDPTGADFKKLGGRSGEWRLRVGRWRVLLRLNNQSGGLLVLRVLPRDRAYRD